MDPYISTNSSKKHDLLKAPTMHLVSAQASVILADPHNCIRDAYQFILPYKETSRKFSGLT